MPDHFLTRIPPSGEFRERQFDLSAQGNSWVLFEPPDDPPWVGVFGNPGIAHYCDLVPFPHDENLVLVIAGAQEYIVDRVSGVLVRKPPEDYCYAAMPVPGTDRIVLADNTRIWTTSPTADADARVDPPFISEDDPIRVGLDGIIFQELTGNRLVGAFWRWDGWFRFTLDLDTMVVQVGSQLTTSSTSFGNLVAEAGRGYPPTPEADRKAISLRLLP